MRSFFTLTNALVWGITFFGLVACGDDASGRKVRREAAAPARALADTDVSQVLLPLQFPLAEFERLLNGRLPDTLVRRPRQGLQPAVYVLLAGKVTLRGEGGNEMVWEVPLAVHVYGRKQKKKENLSSALTIRCRSRVAVGSEWHLQTQTAFDNFEWQEDISLDLGLFKVNLTEPVERLLRKREAEIVALIDAETRKLDLRKALAKTWESLQRPMIINRQHLFVWMSMRPEALNLRQIEITRNTLNLELGAHVRLTFLTDTTQQLPRTPMPALSPLAEAPVGLALTAPILLPWAKLNDVLRTQLGGRKWVVADQRVRLESLQLSAEGHRIRLDARIAGDYQAELIFRGLPAFDTLSRRLRVQRFEYELAKSGNWLIQTSNEFFYEEIATFLANQLVLPLGDLIDSLPHMIYEGIEQGKSGDKLNVVAQPIRVSQVRIEPQADNLFVELKGQTELDIVIERIGKQPAPAM